MSDNKHNQDYHDRSRVSGSEAYEVEYMSKKFNVDPSIVRKAISEVGNNRKAVEAFLKDYKQGRPE